MKSSPILLALIPIAFSIPALAQGTAQQRIACGPDAVRLCASSVPDPDKVAACLQEKRDALGTACRAELDAAGSSVLPRTALTTPPTQAPTAPGDTDKPSAERKAEAQPPQADVQPHAEKSRGSMRMRAREGRAASQSRMGRVRTAYRTRGSIRNREVVAHERDVAEAKYWMRRVTGYSGPLDFGPFEQSSFGRLDTRLR